MAETKKYIMWSDGVLTSFGVEGDTATDGSKTVINPVSIAFAVVNEPVYDSNGEVMKDDQGQPIMKGGLKWEMNPYVFGACLTNPTENVWTINPTYVLSDKADFNDQLVKHYETLVDLCGGKFPTSESGTTPEDETV